MCSDKKLSLKSQLKEGKEQQFFFIYIAFIFSRKYLFLLNRRKTAGCIILCADWTRGVKI